MCARAPWDAKMSCSNDGLQCAARDNTELRFCDACSDWLMLRKLRWNGWKSRSTILYQVFLGADVTYGAQHGQGASASDAKQSMPPSPLVTYSDGSL